MISKENIKKNMMKNIFSSIKDTINEVTAESKNFRENEKQSTAIPVQKNTIPSVAVSTDFIALSQKKHQILMELSDNITRGLKELPAYFNLDVPSFAVNVPIWMTANSGFGVRIYKKSDCEISYESFHNQLCPELNRRMNALSFSARACISKAQIDYERESLSLFNQCQSGIYGEYSTNVYYSKQQELDRAYNSILEHHYHLTAIINFYDFKDCGNWCEFYFTVSQSQ